jgi:hypothetical protein
MNGPLFVVVLIVCLLIMHVTTLVVVFYKDQMKNFLDGITTEYILDEIYRRSVGGARPLFNEPPTMRSTAVPSWYEDRILLSHPASQYGYNESYRGSLQRHRDDVQPLNTITSLPAAPCKKYQPFLHPAFNTAFGNELGTDEGLVPQEKIPSWNSGTAPQMTGSAASGPRACKNFNVFTIQ